VRFSGPILYRKVSHVLIDIIRITWHRKVFIVLFTFAVSLLTLVAVLVTPKTYEALAVVRIVQLADPTSGRIQEPSLIDKMSFMETNKNMLVSRVVLQRLLDRHPETAPPAGATHSVSRAQRQEEAVRILRQSIILESIKFTDLLEIIVRDRNKQKVALIANALVDAYRDWLYEENARTYQDMAEFLDKRVALAKKKLDDSEDAISHYGKANDVVSIENEIKQKLEIVSDLDVRLADIESKIEYNQDLLDKVAHDPKNAPVIAALSSDERVKESVRAYNEMELKIKLSRKYFKPTHPKYIEFLQKREELRLTLLQQLRIGCQSAMVDLQVTREKKNQELQKYKLELSQLGEKSQSYERLKRTLKTDEEVYLNLLNKYEASEMLKAKKSLVEVSLISPAVEPEKHSFPKRTRSMIMGTAFGFFMAILLSILYARKEQILRIFYPGP
jgi:uncharacterized protein involved in exopolysaccharide biosynthesis